MAPTDLLAIFIPLFMQGPAQVRDFVPWPVRISSVECAITRKSSFQGFSKVAKGHFYYDAAAGAAAYEYSAPFSFRFIINDTALFGIDTKHNRGYALGRVAGAPPCDDLYRSIHFFDAYLRCVTIDTALLSVKGSAGPHVYHEREDPSGPDVFSRDKESGAIDLIESFDAQGELYQQTAMRFNEQQHVYEFPVRMVVRKKCGGLLTSDTVLISNAVVNRRVRPELFALPANCRLNAVTDARQGLFFSGQK
jgi:hypothetical protein